MKEYLKICAALISVIVLENCSTDNSAWMQKSGPYINKRRITQITLPGAHFANAYDIKKSNILCKGELSDQSLSNNGRIYKQLDALQMPSGQEDVFFATLNTQEDDILSQLEQGTRYLELGICYQDEIFYTSNLYLTDSLNKIGRQIRQFANANPQEVIIIDLDGNLRAEYGFMNNTDLAQLHTSLVQIFGTSLIPKNKIDQAIAALTAGKQQIIILSSNSVLGAYPEIWNKSTTAVDFDPTYPTIKKISLLENYYNTPVPVPDKLNILPVYSELSLEVLTPEMYETDKDQEIVINYLQRHIGLQPGIIVGAKNNQAQINQIIIRNATESHNAESSVNQQNPLPATSAESTANPHMVESSTGAVVSALIPAPILNPHISASTPKINLLK